MKRLVALRQLGALAVVVACAVAIAAAVPARASAGDLLDCGATVSQPFLAWLDPDSYFLAPGGAFESGAPGWTLDGGATVVSGNEPWHVHAAGDSRSLALPSGASATTASVCIGLADPTVRFFVRNDALLGDGSLVVHARLTVGTLTVELPVGTVTAGSTWQPTLPLPLLANLLSPLPADGTGTVSLTITALGGDWRLDDLYVDPFKTT